MQAKAASRGATGFRGVIFMSSKAENKYNARLRYSGIDRMLGFYSTPAAAARVIDAASFYLFGT